MASVMDRLLRYEIDGKNPPDGREVIRGERMALMAAHQVLETEQRRASWAQARGLSVADDRRPAGPDEVAEAAQNLREVTAEAVRVLEMWQGYS